MNDQASALRKMVNNNQGKKENKQESKDKGNRTRVIAIASGKGGVGKTNLSVNLAYALSNLEKKVLIMDADIGMANIDILLGVTAPYSLKHVIEGKCSVKEAIVETNNGLNILAGISGEEVFIDMGEEKINRLFGASSHLQENYDIIIIDIGAGAHQNVLNFIQAADEALIVLTPEPTAIMDAYSLIKILSNHNFRNEVALIVNMADSNNEGSDVINRMNNVIKEYLNINLKFTGIIPYDKKIIHSVKKQKSLFELYPSSKVVESYKDIAYKLIDKEKEEDKSQNVKGFFSKVVGLFKKG
ncbi:MAG: MinD/ParA family protein [Bacillota bacterium]